MATTAPIGHGHVYAAGNYIDAWMQVADIKNWSPQDVDRLKEHFIAKHSSSD